MPDCSILICTATRKGHKLKWGGKFIDTGSKEEVVIDCTKCECYEECPNVAISRLRMFNKVMQENLFEETQ